MNTCHVRALILAAAIGLSGCDEPSSNAPESAPVATPVSQPAAPGPSTELGHNPEPVPGINFIGVDQVDLKKRDWQYVRMGDEMRDSNRLAAFIGTHAEGITAGMAIYVEKDGTQLGMTVENQDCKLKTCTGAIRIDDAPVEEVTLFPERSEDRIFIVESEKIIPRLAGARSIFVELPVKGHGALQFHFTAKHPLVWPFAR